MKFIGKFLLTNPLPILKSLNIFQYKTKAASLSLLFQILPFIEEKPYDIIHCQFGVLGPEGVHIKQVLGGAIKLVTSFRGYDATKILQREPRLYDELFETGDLFLPVSQSLKDRVVIHGCPQEKIAVLPSGIDCEKFPSPESRDSEDKPITLITVARLVEKKGIAYAIEAAARVLKAGRLIRYVIIGEGRLREGLEQSIDKFGLQGHVQLLGRKNHEEVVQYLRKAHILIAPSMTTKEGDQEGIPNVLKEAMVLGLPVISTYHGGIPELVEDGVSGFLVKEKDVESMAEKIMYLIDHPKVRESIGQVGRAHIQKNYDIQKLNDRLDDLYEQLIGK